MRFELSSLTSFSVMSARRWPRDMDSILALRDPDRVPFIWSKADARAWFLPSW